MRRPALHASSRQEAIQRLRGRLENDGYPRLQMMLLVAITGGVGFLSSYALLRAGLDQMAARYVLACGIAYLAFLGLLWLWMHTRASDYLDVPDLSGVGPRHDTAAADADWDGGGGQSGGGGASSAFDGSSSPSSLSADDAVGDAFGAVADAEEFAIPLMVVVAVVVMLLSSLFVVYSAPILFAELLLDGVLAASLYRRLRRIETRHWLETAIRRTIWPFVLTAVVLAAVGFGAAWYVPEADSIGDILPPAARR